MKRLGVSLLVALVLVLLAIEDTVSVSWSIDSSCNWPSSVRASCTFGFSFFFLHIQKKMSIEEAKKTIKNLRKVCSKKNDTPKGIILFSMDVSKELEIRIGPLDRCDVQSLRLSSVSLLWNFFDQLAEKNVANLWFVDSRRSRRRLSIIRNLIEIEFTLFNDPTNFFSRKFDSRLTVFRYRAFRRPIQRRVPTGREANVLHEVHLDID